MKLRTRLALGFSTVSLLAAGGLFARALFVINRANEQSIEVRREASRRTLRNRQRELARTLRGQTEAIARSLEEGQLSLLPEDFEQRMQAEQLDLLDLIRPDGQFESSGESKSTIRSRGRVDLAAPRRAALTPSLVEVPVDNQGRARLALADTRAVPGGFLLAGVWVEDSGGLASLTGEPFGRLDGLSGRQSFEADHPGPVQLLFTTSLALAPSFDDPGNDLRAIQLSVEYVDEGAAARRGLLLGFAGISALLIAGSILVARVLARRIAAPVDQLADGARALAAGDLDHRVPAAPKGSADELSALVESFNRMAADLKESRIRLIQSERVAAWREIARRIAHEIKNPLTPIQMAVETTRRAHREKRPEFAEIFEESATAILDEVESLKRLVKEFSEFARMPEPSLAPGDLNEAVAGAVRVFTGLPPGVVIKSELAASLPRVMLDREQISRAVLNLIANAAEALGAARGRGEIVLRTCAVDGMVEAHVIDDGPGVAPADRERIFTPYYTTKAQGTGLGLAIVQRIIADHGGEIRVAEGARGGADFVIRLRVP